MESSESMWFILYFILKKTSEYSSELQLKDDAEVKEHNNWSLHTSHTTCTQCNITQVTNTNTAIKLYNTYVNGCLRSFGLTQRT